MKSPFKLLDAYTLEDRDHFFGRDEEIELLYDLIFQARIILIYGSSGTGKTSLIRCGLASRFDGPDWYPFFIRRQSDINESLRIEISKPLSRSISNGLKEAVTDLFSTYLRPVYFIFDQFEELFIFGTDSEKKEFLNLVKDLTAIEIPCRLLFVIREEYLGQLYEFEKEIPTFFEHRLRVEPMSNQKIHSVLKSSFEKFNITLRPDTDESYAQLIDKISEGQSGIHLPYLQVYLDMLYRTDYKRTYPDQDPATSYPPLTFTTKEIESFGSLKNILPTFLNEQVDEIQGKLDQTYPDVSGQFVKQVVDGMVSPEGTKRPFRFHRNPDSDLIEIQASDIRYLPRAKDEVLTSCIESLEKSRLLRINNDFIELAHDSLAELIEKHRSVEQRRLNEARQRLANNYLEYQRTGEYLSQRQLDSFSDILEQLDLGEDIKMFINESYQEAERKAQAEREQRDRELRLTQQKLETEKKAAKRQRALSRWIGLIAVVAIALGIWAWIGNQNLRKASLQRELQHISTLQSQGSYDQALIRIDSALQMASSAEARDQVLRRQETLQALNQLVPAADSLVSLTEGQVLGIGSYLAEAVALYQQARQIDPQSQLLMSKFDRLLDDMQSRLTSLRNSAQGLLNFREYAMARMHFEEAIALVPDDSEAREKVVASDETLAGQIIQDLEDKRRLCIELLQDNL